MTVNLGNSAAPLAPYRRPGLRLRRNLHRLIDPVLTLPNRFRAARRLRGLPDGSYRVPVDVPYVAQFASPDLINGYIHEQLHGRDDPNWQSFGAEDVDQYTFWAHRACAIACVKMAVDAYRTAEPQSVWQLVEEGLALGGYRTHDETGTFVDEGWFYPALVELAARHGLRTWGMAYASISDICTAIRDGWVIAVAVTPDVGERGALRRYDGHFVLVYGFTWQANHCTSLTLHNPSGRYPELRDKAEIAVNRFGAAFAHRFIAFKPL
ncbi:MAG: C39 family peptidase [Chloroflexota bacterium]